MADSHRNRRLAFVAYLEPNIGTCPPKTASNLARLAHFGRFPAEHDPDLESLARAKRFVTSIDPLASSRDGNTDATLRSV